MRNVSNLNEFQFFNFTKSSNSCRECQRFYRYEHKNCSLIAIEVYYRILCEKGKVKINRDFSEVSSDIRIRPN